jgi:hypothetical protein
VKPVHPDRLLAMFGRERTKAKQRRSLDGAAMSRAAIPTPTAGDTEG